MTDGANAGLSGKAKGIRLIALDVDGVLTDGRIIIDGEGTESKNFHVRDGLAIALALRNGMKIALISGRYSKVVEIRAHELGIRDIHQNASDKLKIFNAVLEKHGMAYSEAAFMGDDINDLPVLEKAGLSAAPADADENVKKKVDIVTKKNGGHGAVREVVEFIMTAQKTWGY
ncbi:MAG: HAD hydrolase family protein [Nitrospinota bacterium]